MQILFRTKEEANKEQQEYFLSLAPAERFYEFLSLSERISKFPTLKKVNKDKDNFVISIETHGEKLAN
ncbi:MAG: hypothetical protein KF870_14005 [Leadbetterella sp.]|nr:hypothetical protein [Leadbetterella sp.]